MKLFIQEIEKFDGVQFIHDICQNKTACCSLNQPPPPFQRKRPASQEADAVSLSDPIKEKVCQSSLSVSTGRKPIQFRLFQYPEWNGQY